MNILALNILVFTAGADRFDFIKKAYTHKKSYFFGSTKAKSGRDAQETFGRLTDGPSVPFASSAAGEASNAGGWSRPNSILIVIQMSPI